MKIPQICCTKNFKIGVLLCLGLMAGASIVRTAVVGEMAKRVTKEDLEESQFLSSFSKSKKDNDTR